MNGKGFEQLEQGPEGIRVRNGDIHNHFYPSQRLTDKDLLKLEEIATKHLKDMKASSSFIGGPNPSIYAKSLVKELQELLFAVEEVTQND